MEDPRSPPTDEAIDRVFDEIDDLLRASRFAECDQILRGVDPERLPSDLMVALLTSTAAARDHLTERAPLAQRVRAALARLKGEDYAQRLLEKLA